MNKVALNFICKNEAHIIERMLASASPIADLIVAVDTGSTDDTISKILSFGKSRNISAFVFERPFDDFASSRNYAMIKLKEKAKESNWDLESSWGFTVDCDEWVKFLPGFHKEDLCADFYVVRQRIGRETFTRHGLFKLSKHIRWESPIHETLVYNDPTIIKQYEFNIEVIEEPVGASWKGDLVEKFLRYARVLTAYLEDGHCNFRTVFFIGDSYNAAASYCNDDKRAKELYRMAEKYFMQALTLETNSPEIRFMLQKKIAENTQALGQSWPKVKKAYLNAFLECPLKAETFAVIIEHYIDEGNWELAYYYSKFSYQHFVINAKSGQKVMYNDESLYVWRLLFCLYFTAFRSGRRTEAERLYKKLSELKKVEPAAFSREDLLLIQIHAPVILIAKEWRKKLQKAFGSILGMLTQKEHTGDYGQPAPTKKIHYAA